MDKIKKKGLGRGLSSLIGETKVEPLKNQLSMSDLFQININQEKFLMRII